MTSPPRKTWQNDGRTYTVAIKAWLSQCRRCGWYAKGFSRVELVKLRLTHDPLACELYLALKKSGDVSTDLASRRRDVVESKG